MVTDKCPNGLIGPTGLNPIGPIGLIGLIGLNPIGPNGPIGLIAPIGLNPSNTPTPCYYVTLLLRYSGVCKKYVKK